MTAKISFCIPTFNREQLLNELIESIVSQCSEDMIPLVEICIADNASTDETKAMVENWITKTAVAIQYASNTENIGPDRNYLRSVELANGEYCWLFGSDDVLAPGALSNMLRLIGQGQHDIYLTNRTDCDINMQPLYQRFLLPEKCSSQVFNLGEDQIFLNYLNTIASIGGLFSYLSSIVVRHGCWNTIPIDEQFIGSAYSHVYILMKYISKFPTTLYYDKIPSVLCRQGNDFFMNEGIAKRVFIDLYGYTRLANTIYPDKPAIRQAIIGALYRTRPTAMTLMVIRQKSNDQTWHSVKPELRIFYPSWAIKTVGLLKHVINIAYWTKKTLFSR